eukprot:CAMPEP_0181308206 /NCGR_PEP_ID=MMETSP1101-20121128/11328_1 /TAXON_ID=46948 /ORGANISM="Rhodomonas abbreviata, Strain Caron Lab Isolate" /LENGTH=494 /DNA_ID=CAMNT_0023414551 /DNA_START=256 /DNA_END=1736 /DNA_ORIENTATION=+
MRSAPSKNCPEGRVTAYCSKDLAAMLNATLAHMPRVVLHNEDYHKFAKDAETNFVLEPRDPDPVPEQNVDAADAQILQNPAPPEGPPVVQNIENSQMMERLLALEKAFQDQAKEKTRLEEHAQRAVNDYDRLRDLMLQHLGEKVASPREAAVPATTTGIAGATAIPVEQTSSSEGLAASGAAQTTVVVEAIPIDQTRSSGREGEEIPVAVPVGMADGGAAEEPGHAESAARQEKPAQQKTSTTSTGASAKRKKLTATASIGATPQQKSSTGSTGAAGKQKRGLSKPEAQEKASAAPPGTLQPTFTSPSGEASQPETSAASAGAEAGKKTPAASTEAAAQKQTPTGSTEAAAKQKTPKSSTEATANKNTAAACNGAAATTSTSTTEPASPARSPVSLPGPAAASIETDIAEQVKSRDEANNAVSASRTDRVNFMHIANLTEIANHPDTAPSSDSSDSASSDKAKKRRAEAGPAAEAAASAGGTGGVQEEEGTKRA